MRGDYSLILTEEDFGKKIERFRVSSNAYLGSNPKNYPCAISFTPHKILIHDPVSPTLLRNSLYPSDWKKLLDHLLKNDKLTKENHKKLMELPSI